LVFDSGVRPLDLDPISYSHYPISERSAAKREDGADYIQTIRNPADCVILTGDRNDE